MVKQYIVQRSMHDPLPQQVVLDRVNYQDLLWSLRFPVLWVYEHYLQAWLPREVDHAFITKLTGEHDERLQRRLELLGMHEEPRTTWEELNAALRSQGAVVIKRLLPQGYCQQLAEHYYRQPELHDRWQDMPGIKRTSTNNLPLFRHVHQATEKLVNYVTGDAKTSYVFTSSYEAGTILPAHTDRPQCVYNISLMLASDPSEGIATWPIYIKTPATLLKAGLDVGDAVLYSGVRDLHWRDELPAQMRKALGTFFHYVPRAFSGSLD